MFISSPMNDWIDHRLEDCLCDPEIIYIDPDTELPWSTGGTKIVHKALDGRED